MYIWQDLDLGDSPSRITCARIKARTGVTVIPQKRLEHASCNRSAGAHLGNRLRKAGIRRARPRPPAVTGRRSRAARW